MTRRSVEKKVKHSGEMVPIVFCYLLSLVSGCSNLTFLQVRVLRFNIPGAEPKSVTPVYMFVDPLPTEVAPCFSHVFRLKSVAEKYQMDEDKQKKKHPNNRNTSGPLNA